MKLTGASIIAVAGLLQTAYADFEIYRIGSGGNGISANVEGWHVYQNEVINCNGVHDWLWRASTDVSGGKYGVRCQGNNGCGRSASSRSDQIDRLEMNFNSNARHWTYYKDRDGGLYDLSDRRVGRCYPWPAAPLNCGVKVGRVEGYRKLKCEIGVNAATINAGRPKKRGTRHEIIDMPAQEEDVV